MGRGSAVSGTGMTKGEPQMQQPQAKRAAARPPVRWLNYPGDRTRIDHGTPLGPNTLGEWLWPVEAAYDPVTDRTRVGLSYIPPGGAP